MTQDGDDPVKIAKAYDTDTYGRPRAFSGAGADDDGFAARGRKEGK